MAQRYLIFGGTGSLGRKLIERLISHAEVCVYSRDEAKHWTIRNEFVGSQYESKLKFYVGDVRDRARVTEVIRQVKPSIVIMAAALKQVDTCELSPSESIMTNVIGTENVIAAVNSLNQQTLHTVLFVSTDKACAPVNVYGMCKALSERIVTSQAQSGLSHVNYLAVRYGNVLESRGSIIPLFKYQAENAEVLTVTDPNMTRFVMTLDDSVNLISNAITLGRNGDTWIPKLPSMRIGDLADIFSERFKKPIKTIGLRPGEKLHEDLINESESSRTYQASGRGENNFVIEPAFKSGNFKRFTYTSADDVMTKEQLGDLLFKLKIIETPLAEFKGLAIEEIATNRRD